MSNVTLSPRTPVGPRRVEPASERLAADRMRRLEAFVSQFSRTLALREVPQVVLVDSLQAGSAHYDELSNQVRVPREVFSWEGARVRKLLAHELIHAWQNQTGALRWNLDQVGHYLEAPSGDLGQILRNPLKLGRLIGYALQPSELHAELSRMVRQALRALPPAPW